MIVSALLSFILLISATNGAEPNADASTESSGSSDGKILASKLLLSRYAVEDKEFVVDYHLYNVGDQPAVKVTLDDTANFPSTHFEILKGVLNVEWDRIAPGTNVSHSAIIKPLYYGPINFTVAAISYYPSETATSARKGYTSAPGESYIYRLRDYERKFASRYIEWAIFALATTPSLVFPALLWYRSKSKYEQLAAMKEKKQA